jgi:uncharacterized membrane protein YeaQ/YmgE (transglycosylase-associated protein family)
MLTVIIGFIVVGLVIGFLGRLIAPGPNPIGIGATIVAGLAGSILGGLIAAALVGTAHPWIALLFEVLVAAVIVTMFSRSKYGARRI